MRIGKHLYHYASVSENEKEDYTYQNLLNQKIYFSSLRYLNDLFEGMATILGKDNGMGEIERMFDLIDDRISEMMSGGLRDQWVISSFTEDPKNVLMWAHYGKAYTGVCIRYKTSDVLKVLETNGGYIGLMQYSCERPQWDVAACPKTNEERVAFIKNFLYKKSSEWEYEKEVRAICSSKKGKHAGQDGRLFDIKADAIYFGLRMNKRVKARYVDVCKKFNIEVYQMNINSRNYEIDYTKFM